MLVTELFEANLPLRKGVLRNAVGNYDAMVCVMDPHDFIRLTTVDDEGYEEIFADTKVDLQAFKAGAHPEKNVGNYNMPFLKIILETGKVTGHEGRHRAAMVAMAGGRSFPCTIQYRTPHFYELTYTLIDYENEEEEDRVETFHHEAAARARRDEIEAMKTDLNAPGYPVKVKLEIYGHDVMKGSPRSVGWERDAWRKTDIPAQLIGQYNSAVVIPTSRMKFGIVKGHTHFR